MAICSSCIKKSSCELCKELGTENAVRMFDFNCEDYEPAPFAEEKYERPAYKRPAVEPATCTKKNSRDCFQVKCSCGLEMVVDISYWRKFRFCPNCGTECKGRWSNGSKQRK